MKIHQIFLLAFAAIACGGGYNSSGSFVDHSKEINSASPVPNQPRLINKIVKTGGLSYKVESTQVEYNRVSQILSEHEGFIAMENEVKRGSRISFVITIKVPPQQFDSLINKLSKGKILDNRWVNMDNVTEQYYDLKSRIDNKKKLEERYQEILKKANNVTDILEIEKNLNEVRTDIESFQKQFKLLNHQINYSNLNLTFYELLPYQVDNDQRPGFDVRIINALFDGWNQFLSLITFTVSLWPFGLLVFILILLIKEIRKRRKKRLLKT